MTNVAILGAGNIARQMAKTLRLMKARDDKVELYAVGSRDKARAEAFAQAEGFAKAYGSYGELLRDDGVDLVYIATPHSHHGEQIEQCVTHGKAVLCEKAFTATAAQAVKSATRAGSSRGLKRAERYSPQPLGDWKERPSRPRPPVCSSAVTTSPSGAPAMAQRLHSVLVESTVSRHSSSRPTMQPDRGPASSPSRRRSGAAWSR